MQYDWHFGVVLDSLPLLLQGLGWSILIGVVAMVAGSAVGLGIALLRIARVPVLSQIAIGYIEFFRSTPVLAQLLWVYYALPITTGWSLSALQSALLAFSLNVGAFMAEIFRAGILGVPRGQREAALALGLSRVQAYRRILLPQAVRSILPASANIWLSLVKDTSIASVIAVAEMMYRARALAVTTYRPVEVFTVAGALYFVVVYLQSTLLERVTGTWLGGTREAAVPAGPKGAVR